MKLIIRFKAIQAQNLTNFHHKAQLVSSISTQQYFNVENLYYFRHK